MCDEVVGNFHFFETEEAASYEKSSISVLCSVHSLCLSTSLYDRRPSSTTLGAPLQAMLPRTRSVSNARVSSGRTKQIVEESTEIGEAMELAIANGDESTMNKSLDQLIEMCRESKNRGRAFAR